MTYLTDRELHWTKQVANGWHMVLGENLFWVMMDTWIEVDGYQCDRNMVCVGYRGGSGILALGDSLKIGWLS